MLAFVTDTDVNLLPHVEEGALLTSEGQGSVPSDDVSFDGTTTLGVEIF